MAIVRVYRAELGVASEVRVYRAELTVPEALANVRVYRAELTSTGVSSAIRVYRAELTTGGVGAVVRVYRAEVTVAGQASLGLDRVGIEPFSTLTLTATAPGTPTSWSFARVSGPTVTLVPSGNTVSFVVPAAQTTQTLVLSVTANYASGSPSSGTTNIEILYATEYVNTSTGWIPVRIQTMVP